MKLVMAALLVALSLAGCTDDAPTEALDSDNDGYSDAAEILAGTDPTDPNSIPGQSTYPIWGDLGTAQIRPGSSLGGYCTFNFLYEGPNGTGYIGTAAHCTDGTGEIVTLPGVGEIGEVVYDSDESGSGVDFSLIALFPDMINKSHPQMLAYDGPTDWINTTDLAVGDIIQVYGYGMVVGENEPSRPRQGLLVDWNEDEYNVDMPAVNGDSGAPLLHQSGKAFGIISRYGTANVPPSTDQGPMMDYIFRSLAEGGYGDVRLATI